MAGLANVAESSSLSFGRHDAAQRFWGLPRPAPHLLGLLVGRLLLGGLPLISTRAGAQPVEPAGPGAHAATTALEEQAAARVAAAVCSKRIVLLGELPEHGEARGFGVKARVVQRLVASCGFRAVLFEAAS